MKNGKFEVGDKVRVATKRWDEDGDTQYGDVGVVEVLSDTSLPVGVMFGEDRNQWCEFNTYDHEDLELVKTTQPSVAADLRLKPQSKTVLRHLKAESKITPMKALIVYGISRLAACIYDIRQAGYKVTTKTKNDAQGHKYAEYALVK